MIAVGLILLLGAVGYYAYAHFARSGFDDLSFSVDPISVEAVPRVSSLDESTSSAEETTPVTITISQSPEQADASVVDTKVFPIDSFSAVYPGTAMHPKYWARPLWAGSDRRTVADLPDGFTSVSWESGDTYGLQVAAAHRIVISDIGIDAVVNDLKILDLGDSTQYETPKNIVGHIPGTANPGEFSNGWYFGHLQSPIKGEGSVFRWLPKISELVKDGDPIFVSLYSADGEYLYQVVKGEVVRPSELELTPTTEAEITLVTCYPPLVYDHRYVITAKLVGVRN